jgi:aminomuconate-semialdehyde/2-hydroxymuconate-6-semialdehyde dehydrogenase
MDSGHHAYTRFEPAGVVAAIAPWNFPLMLESWKVAPALAWGNTVVLKPAEDTPASAALMASLALAAGLPPGVLNVLQGYGPDSAGAALTAHPAVDRITFTGESGTGKTIARAAAANLVPVSLELGGKGANIVFDDADLDNAVAWSIRAIFSNAGQVCLAGSRLYAQRGIYAEFTDRFVAAAKALVAGDPKDGPPSSARWRPSSITGRSAPTWTASRPTAARSGPAASATAGWCCPRWWRTPRRPRASAARRCSARW